MTQTRQEITEAVYFRRRIAVRSEAALCSGTGGLSEMTKQRTSQHMDDR